MVLSRPGHIRRPGPPRAPPGILPPMDEVDVECEGRVVEWRGPSPWYFVRIPEEESDGPQGRRPGASSTGGRCRSSPRIHDHEFVTALFPKDGPLPAPAQGRRTSGPPGSSSTTWSPSPSPYAGPSRPPLAPQTLPTRRSARRLDRLGRLGRLAPRRLGRLGQGDPEGAAPADLALQRHRAVVGGHDRADDVEPEPGAGDVLLERLAAAEEAAEDVLDLVRRRCRCRCRSPRARPRRGRAGGRRVTEPPASLYLTALESRLSSTWRMRCSSTRAAR